MIIFVLSANFSVSEISKRPASKDSEEEEASDGVDQSPSRYSRLKVAGQAPARTRDPRAERTVRARVKGVEEGIEIGKRESAEKIEDQNTLIKERDIKIKKQEKQINRLTDQLALEAAHLLLAGQRSDLSATSMSTLTADNNRQREENARLEKQVALLTGQLAQKTEEVDTVTTQNARLCAESPNSQSPAVLRI